MWKIKLCIVCIVIICGFIFIFTHSSSLVDVNSIPDKLTTVNNKKRIRTSEDVMLYKEGVFIPEAKSEGDEQQNSGSDGSSQEADNEAETFQTGGIPDTTEPVGRVDTPSMTQRDTEIAKYNESEAWTYITGGVFKDYPRDNFSSIHQKILGVKSANSKTIKVKVWVFSNPGTNDLSKTTGELSFNVNSNLADTFEHIFRDIYNHSSKPVFNIRDFGCWSVRAKVSGSTASAHAFGSAVDINYSTSMNVGGVTYGNTYGAQVMPAGIWSSQPDSQTKYYILYDGCPIVEVFKAYGFYWGGDWNSTKDPMHIGYCGDGGGRQRGIANYISRGGK